MPEDAIPDDEVVFRRIPPGERWFEPPDRMSSANFKLRPGEAGLSVFRQQYINQEDVLSRPEAIDGSFVVSTTVGEIRRAKNGKGESLGLDVIVPVDETDSAHAEIRGTFTSATANALRRLFHR